METIVERRQFGERVFGEHGLDWAARAEIERIDRDLARADGVAPRPG